MNRKFIYQPEYNDVEYVYVTKIVPWTSELSPRFMFGDFRKNYQKAGLDARKYLWKIINEWDNASDDRIEHWQRILVSLKPTWYGNCIISYAPHQKEDAEILMRCLKWMEEQEKYDITLSVRARCY